MKTLFNVQHSTINIDLALLVTRVALGILMLTHGIPKIALLQADPVMFVDFMGLGATTSLLLAIFAEVICSVLIIVGLGTRFAAVPLIITMLVAVFMVHAADPFSIKELALHYLLGYLILLVLGSGKYSIDSFISKR